MIYLIQAKDKSIRLSLTSNNEMPQSANVFLPSENIPIMYAFGL